KMLLAAISMTGLLASCGGGLTMVDPVRNLTLTSYSSEYSLATPYYDAATGTTYATGTPVICDNTATDLYATLDWDGMASQFGAQLEGRDTGETGVVTVRGMKKMLLAAISMTGLLASCGGGLTMVDPVRNLTLT
ncbi:hypothetical protein CTI14_43730, partial [Methylobacterium radiotolerans]